MANSLEEFQRQILQLQQQLHGQSFVSSTVSHATVSGPNSSCRETILFRR